jgi:hypothetical protein
VVNETPSGFSRPAGEAADALRAQADRLEALADPIEAGP